MNIWGRYGICLATFCLLQLVGSVGQCTRIGILSQPGFPRIGAPSDPRYLAELLRRAGYELVTLSADDLLDPKGLDAKDIPVVVLPYGPVFPGEAASNWKRYLHEGGSFFSTGGYAFDEPVYERGGKWLTWKQLIARDPKWIANGAFKGDGGWTVEGDRAAAHFGPDPNLGGKPGLVLGYPYETSYKSGGKETSVKVRQSFAAPPPGRYEIHFMRYMRWTNGPGKCSVTLTTLDGQGKQIKEYDLNTWGQAPGVAFGPVPRRFDVTPETKMVGVAISVDKLSGVFGISDMKVYQWPEGRDMNSRHGESTDGMTVVEDCITAFDASFPLRYTAAAESDPGQVIAPSGLKLKGPFEGWVADSTTGDYSRQIPIIKGMDRYGRPRGAVGSIVYRWGRYFENSAWAIFGVTNKDIFARGDRDMARVFVNTMDRLVNRLYLFQPKAEWPSYRVSEEPIKLFAPATNKGAATQKITVRLRVLDETGREIFRDSRASEIQPGGTAEFESTCGTAGSMPGGFYRIVAVLEKDGKPYDRQENGFFIWDENKVKGGPQYELKDNVFTVNGRPTFMPGADMHAEHISRAVDGPLCWYNDAKAMRDFGLFEYQTLDPWDPWRHTEGAARDRRRNTVLRRVDGVTMACRQAGLEYMPCQIITGDMAFSYAEEPYDQRISNAAAASEEYFSRVNYPTAIHQYIGGDIQVLLPEKPWLLDEWNKFLKNRYQDAESLRAAWGSELVGEPFADKRQPSQDGDWSSRRAIDSTDFARWLEENYINQVGDAARKASPGSVLTIEYQSTPSGLFWTPGSYTPDAWAGQQMLDISNVINAAYRLGVNDGNKYPDMSLIGKPLTIGEWGNLIHPANARSQGGLTESEGDEMWLNQNCQMFGMGAAQVRQWSWRDLSSWETWLFNWGSVHSQYFVPKEAGRMIRSLYLLFRMPEPKYQVQPVALVIPTSHRRGSTATQMALVTRNANKLLGASRVDYAPIAEDCLDKLPKGVRALVWPMPHCPDDATVARIKAFVEDGGALYVSGDISYDENRQLTRESRLEALFGVNVATRKESRRGIPNPPEVAGAGAQWQSPFWFNKLGKGFVCYLPQNLEDAPIDQGQFGGEGWRNPPRTDTVLADSVAVYRDFLCRSGLEPLVKGGTPETRCWVRYTTDGGTFYTLFNGDAFGRPVELTLPTAAGEFHLSVPAARPSLIWVDGSKRVRAVMAEGVVTLDEKRLFSAEKMTVISTLTPSDIRTSRALTVMPLWAGTVNLPGKAGDTAVMGDIHGGKWRTLETRKVTGGSLRFDSLQAREFTVITGKADRNRAEVQVEAWIMRPWEAAGASF